MITLRFMLGMGALLLPVPVGMGQELKLELLDEKAGELTVVIPPEVDLFEGKAGVLKVELPPRLPDADAGKEQQDQAPDVDALLSSLLTSEVRTALREFAGKAGEVRRRQLHPELEKTVGKLTGGAKLDAAGTGKLKALAAAAMDESMKVWVDKFCVRYATYLVQSGDPAATLKSWKPEQFVNNTALGGLVSPTRTAVWKEGLKTILTAEHAAALQVEQSAEEAKVLEEMSGYLDASEARVHETMSGIMEQQLNQILPFTEIDGARQEKLRSAAAEAVKLTLKDWRRRAGENLLGMDEASRKQISARNGLMAVDPDEKANRPQEQAAWQSVRNGILTDDERKAAEEGQKQSRNRRADALAVTLIAEIDRLVGLSGPQREKLLELGRPGLLTLPQEFFTASDNGYSSIATAQLLTKLKEIPEPEINGLLEPGQLKRWKDLSQEQLSTNRTYIRQNAAAATGKVPEAIDEGEAERLISLILAKESGKVKQRFFSMMEAKVENVTRVTAIPAETGVILLTAAKGSAERMAQNPVTSLDQYVRQQLKGVKPAEVPARLKNLSIPSNQERQLPEEPRLWTAAMERLLTAPQQEAWKNECQARSDWYFRGLSAMVATEVEKHLILKPEQNDALRKKLDGIIRKYETDITNFLSHGWHLQSYYCTLPVALLTEKEMAEIFSAKEIETVRTRCLGQSAQYADMIRQQHARRPKKPQ